MEKGFGYFFTESWKEYGRKFIPILQTFLIIYFIPIVVVGLIFFALIVGLGIFSLTGMAINETNPIDLTNLDSSNLSAELLLTFILLLVIFVIIVIIINVLYTIGVIHISLSKKNKISFKEVFRLARRDFWKYLAFSIVVTFFLFLLYLLLIIPGIIFTVYWALAAYILINENKGILESLSASKQMIKGRWWLTFGYMFLLILIIFVISVFASFVPLIGDFISPLILTPYFIIFLKNYYLELKKGKKVDKKAEVKK